MALADEQLPERHAVDLPAWAKDHFGRGQLMGRYPALELGTDPSHPVGALQGLQPLSTVDGPRCETHHTSTMPPIAGCSRLARLTREAAEGTSCCNRTQHPQ